MQPFSFFFVIRCGAGGGGISGRVRALNLTVPLGSGRVGSGQTISGTGRVRASVLSPCRPLALVQMSMRLGTKKITVYSLQKTRIHHCTHTHTHTHTHKLCDSQDLRFKILDNLLTTD